MEVGNHSNGLFCVSNLPMIGNKLSQSLSKASFGPDEYWITSNHRSSPSSKRYTVEGSLTLVDISITLFDEKKNE